MRHPNFLVVGAMKAGTTTLYHDLSAHPQLFLPQQKEPEDLVNDSVLSNTGRAEYARLFRAAETGQLCGEASTAYTKRPDFEGCCGRAWRVLGAGTKILYIVRDPVERAISHYIHERAEGLTALAPLEAFSQQSRYAMYSRYAYQITPWRETFGDDNVLLIPFEYYVSHRSETIARVCAFLDIDSAFTESCFESAYNVSSERRIVRSRLHRALVYSTIYQRRLKPLLPRNFREAAKRILLRRNTVNDAGRIGDTERDVISKSIPEADWALYHSVLHSWQTSGLASAANSRH